MTALPVHEYIEDISSLIWSNSVTQINAPTGSGKSIGVPEHLAKQGATVFVSVPTRVSATSLCDYLKIRNPDMSIGYAADGISKYNDNTKVVYATSGHIRRKLLSIISKGTRHGFTFADVLILDETHSGSLDNTVIISLWMYVRKMGKHVPKLVLLSATPSTLPIDPDPVVFDVPVPSPYPVQVYYDPVEDGANIYEQAASIVLGLRNDPRFSGDILVFVPGAGEAEEVMNYLLEYNDLMVIPAYSTMAMEDIKKIYEPTPLNMIKVIVATNIAESSLTIDGIVFVVDTMLCKEPVLSASGAIRLETNLITKSSAQQRKGRCGRTKPGVCVRLINESMYDTLENHRRPEIERMPIHETVMEFFDAGLDPVTTIVGVDHEKVISSIELLLKLELLKDQPDKIVVTNAGNFAPKVPLDVRTATFLWRWIQDGHPMYPGIVLAGLIGAYNIGYFFVPRKMPHISKDEYESFCYTYVSKTFKKWRGYTQLHTYLNMWIDLAKSVDRVHHLLMIDPSKVHIGKWCQRNSVAPKQLRDAISIMSQTYKVIRTLPLRIDSTVVLFDVNEIMALALPILQELNSDNILMNDHRGEYHHPKTSVLQVFDKRRYIADIEQWSMTNNSIIPIVTHEMATKNGRHLGIIDLCIPAPSPSVVKESKEIEDPEELGPDDYSAW